MRINKLVENNQIINLIEIYLNKQYWQGKVYMKTIVRIYFISIIMAILPVNSFASSIDSDDIKELLQKNSLIIAPQFHNVNSGFGKIRSEVYYYIKSNSRLFESSKPVKVTIEEIDISKNDIVLRINNNILGNGVIKFFINNVKKIEYTNDEIASLIYSSFSDNSKYVFCDDNTDLCHLTTSNHYDVKSKSIEYVKMKDNLKYRKCGFCFSKHNKLHDFRTEAVLAKKSSAEIRYNSPTKISNEQIVRIEKIGRNILSNWPLKLLGYDYTFTILADPEINAVAIPTGQIFINMGLINAVEGDDELEAVLVHEIAHVELRHSLRSYNIGVEKVRTQQTIAMIGAIAGSVAGAAAASGNTTAATISSAAAVGSLAGMIATEIYYSGYSKDHENEADELAIMYFDKFGKSRNIIARVFKKLMYHNLNSINNPDPSSLTHPYLSSRFDNTLKYKYNIINKSYVTMNKKPNQVNINILYEVENADWNYVVAYISDRAILESNVNIESLSILINSGSKELTYSFDKTLINSDQWGSIIIMKPYNRDYKLPDISDICLIENHKTNDNPYMPQNVYKYTLVPGDLDSLL
jgi:Zn-dependent protease with chaperone function